MSATLAPMRARRVALPFAAALGAAVLARYGLDAAGVIAAFTCIVLVALSLIDLGSHRLPNRIVLPAAALVLTARLATAPHHWTAWVGAALGAFAGFLMLALIYPAGLGMGDVKLMLLLGATLGGAVLPALLIGTLAGSIAALILLVRHGTAARRRAIAFGPFLSFGAVVVILTLAP